MPQNRLSGTNMGGSDPNYASGDLVLNVETGAGDAGGSANTYTVEPGDNLSKIGAKYGISWNAIYEANRDIIQRS